MIAYDPSGLDNRYARREAEEAESENIISSEEHSRIRNAFPDPFYTPVFFARLGFFVLTLICLGFSGGMFAAITDFGNGIGLAGLMLQMLLMGALSVIALEWMIRNKKHLASGVDDALLYSGFGFITGAFYVTGKNLPPVLQSVIFLIAALACVIRYADRLMALIAFFALLCLVFFTGLRIGAIGKALMPFILMAVCALCYFAIAAGIKRFSLRHYQPVFKILRIAALFCLYAAGNYFVVREANHAMSPDPSLPAAEIPLSWLFWIITDGLPLLYIYAGIRHKDRLFLDAGLILIAATAFTLRYYHPFLPPEMAMLAGGSVLFVLALIFMRVLKNPRNGITSVRTGMDPFGGFAQVEALIIDETLSPAMPVASNPGVEFGGGSGGGGGAGGQF